MVKFIYNRLLAIWSMRYRLQTLSMLTDIKIIKQNGITSVNIIDFEAPSEILAIVWASDSDSANDGITSDNL